RCTTEAPMSELDFHMADDAVPGPAARRLLTGPARFFEQEGQWAVLLAPRLQLRAHRTRTRNQRDQPHALFEAQPQRPFAVSLAVSHNAAHPVESERQTLLNRY